MSAQSLDLLKVRIHPEIQKQHSDARVTAFDFSKEGIKADVLLRRGQKFKIAVLERLGQIYKGV